MVYLFILSMVNYFILFQFKSAAMWTYIIRPKGLGAKKLERFVVVECIFNYYNEMRMK